MDITSGGGRNGGTAGIFESEDFCDFVKTFADSIIKGGTDYFEMVMFFHVNDLGVTTRDDEGEEGEGGLRGVLDITGVFGGLDGSRTNVFYGGSKPVGVNMRF